MLDEDFSSDMICFVPGELPSELERDEDGKSSPLGSIGVPVSRDGTNGVSLERDEGFRGS